MTTCPHLPALTTLSAPRLIQSVHREECTQCFDNQDSEGGVDVCLSCFNGGCIGERAHATRHAERSGHVWALNVKRRFKPSIERTEDSAPPAKITKLAIPTPTPDEDKYIFATTLKCLPCSQSFPALAADAQVTALVDGVMTSMTSARQSEVKAWEEEILACEHTLTLHPSPSPVALTRISSQVGRKYQCDTPGCGLEENLWLCLACGNLGCGRQQMGGVNGNGHAKAHYEGDKQEHMVAVKLGTITAEGNADIYCYTCDDSKLDPELGNHLAAFGIRVEGLVKTEKSITELQIEQNLNFDFSLTGEDGKALEPVFGPGLTGLANLGNSCYMASVLQTIFSLPAFQQRYDPYDAAPSHWSTCPTPLPADCVECQMFKISDGLLTGRYSKPTTHVPQHPDHTSLQHDSPTPVFQEGIKPTGFKALIGKGHEEFGTMRQQDSEEFLGHLVTVLRRYARSKGTNENEATEIFGFAMEQKLQCTECHGVRYRTDGFDLLSVPVSAKEKGKKSLEGGGEKVVWEEVQLVGCLEAVTGVEGVAEYACPKCAKGVTATKQSKFKTFPDVLVVHAKKFQLVNWVPTKLDIPITLPPNDSISLDAYFSTGLQPTETELPAESTTLSTASGTAQPQFDEAAVSQLESMGFPTFRCQKALLATGGNDAEAAMEWLFGHMEDPDIDEPIPSATVGGGGGNSEPSAEQVGMLSDMGFTPAQAMKALRETGGNAERAVEWLFSHPDETGEEDPSTLGGSSSATAAPLPLAGSPNLPAHYKLKAFISHKGPSVHSGHYVAHIRGDGDEWVLFNDEKVVKADEESVKELKKLAYLYIFEKH